MGTRTTRVLGRLAGRFGMSMQTKLILIFLAVKVIPLLLLCVIAWRQLVHLGEALRTIAVTDSAASLNDSAVKNIERMSTDAANAVAGFLYARDSDIAFLAGIEPSEDNYRAFIRAKTKRVIRRGEWELSPDGKSWVETSAKPENRSGVSSNSENNDMDGFNPRPADAFDYVDAPLYDEVSFVDTSGREPCPPNPNRQKTHG